MKAIILAGEEKKEGILEKKALSLLKGIPMIQYVINSLKDSKYVDCIYVVGDRTALYPVIGDQVEVLIEEGGSLIDNLLLALDHCGEEKVLIITCDIPLIHVEVINSFIDMSLKTGADICYPIVEKSIYERRYPDTKRTYISLKDGIFTGGNMILLTPSIIYGIQDIIKIIIENRKDPLKMGRVLGWPFLLRLLSKILKIEDIESHIEKRFHIRGRAIISHHPEIANDIDNIEDIKLIEMYL